MIGPFESVTIVTIKKTTLVTIEVEVKDTKMIDLSLQISIGTDTMKIGATKVSINTAKDTFKNLGPFIVGNIIDYSNSKEEEEKKKSEEKKRENKKGKGS